MQLKWLQNVRTIGITEARADGLRLCWSASGIEFDTSAQTLRVEIEAESAREEEDAFLGIFYDESSSWETRIRIMPGRRWYEIHVEEGHRIIRLLKLTEEQYGTLCIVSLEADAPMKPTQETRRRILFVGDSLTAGYGVTGRNEISVFQTEDEDVTLAYAYLAGAALGAENTIVAYSGNGVLSRWIPPEIDTPLTEDILPSIFPYKEIGMFDLIVCNLGTNDSSYTKQKKEREDAFAEKYCAFIERIRQVAPETPILLLYGLMEQTLCEKVKEVAERCKTEFLALPLQNADYGMGTDGHPCAKTQRETADYVQKYIRTIKKW